MEKYEVSRVSQAGPKQQDLYGRTGHEMKQKKGVIDNTLPFLYSAFLPLCFAMFLNVLFDYSLSLL